MRCTVVVLACVMTVGATAAEPDGTAEKYYAMAEYWVGDWKADYDVVDEEAMEVMGGRKATADVSIKWSAEKKCSGSRRGEPLSILLTIFCMPVRLLITLWSRVPLASSWTAGHMVK